MTIDRISLDGLRRIQATLQRRVVTRDPDNIMSVGFAPAMKRDDAAREDQRVGDPGVVAQFDVRRKLKRVSAEKKVQPIECVRLLDRDRSEYREVDLITTLQSVGDIVPTGVRVSTTDDHATTSIVVRWTTFQPVPPRPTQEQPDDPRWRWGVITVSHLFVGRGDADAKSRGRVRRVAACGDGPDAVSARVIARGRIPGGPDVALMETGWDRLWLSGFLPKIGLPPLVVVSKDDLVRWSSAGVTGTWIGERITHRWKWETFYPMLTIPGLGRLQNIVAYRHEPSTSSSSGKPFGPGTSGGALVVDGLVLGVQVAAMRPSFTIGYAQTCNVSMTWLRKRLTATALDVVHIVDGQATTRT